MEGFRCEALKLVQELKPNDLPQRRIFGEWALGKLAEDPIFYRKSMFSEEAQKGRIVDFRVKISQKNWKRYQCIPKINK